MRRAGKYLIIFFFAMQNVMAQQNHADFDPVEYVNPLVGSASKHSLSTGNTYPAISLPWGMNFWTPQTGKMGDGWAYTYDADKIVGFKQTHQPSPWMNDYGQFAVMPITGKAVFKEDERASWFSHKSEIAKPYYYSVYEADHDITTEIAPTERAAYFRVRYPAGKEASLVIDALDSGSYIKVMPGARKIIGYSTRNKGGVPAGFKNYFVIVADQPIRSFKIWKDNRLEDGLTEVTARHAGAVITFGAVDTKYVHLRIASSFISIEQAELNLSRELGNADFDQIKQKAKDAWNKELSKIKVEGGTTEQLRTFYSCLYRCLLFPQKHYEIEQNGKIVHYSPYNGKVLPGYMYAGTGFWDTFRALYPFLNLVYPAINREMQQALINDYKEGGWLPEWSSPGYRNIMIGNNSASVVADAWLKGVRGYDIETLYQALVKGANHAGPMPAVGRYGVDYYNSLGYVPYDAGINQNAARTLEYAYDDFCIYQLAKALNKPAAEVDLYRKRAMNYRNVFDTQTGLMRGRNKDGSFQAPFNPFKWGDAFTEGNSWHYTWSVFQDISGLINLMGGKKEFVTKLDSVFTIPPVYDQSYYRSVIHEIREMQIMNMGQYAHGNQPIQHMIYLYNYAGQPWKTQKWVREVENRFYLATPDGYCGDEDNGQTSAWYVFSAMGFYPVCPGAGQYVLGAPLFKKISIRLDNGKTIRINANNNSPRHIYVQSLKLNGAVYQHNWLSHDLLMKGANLEFNMSARPNFYRGINPKDFPYSLSNDISINHLKK
ncbi:GH92 family glycosyl hydrolase [Mucilaginibacter sp.]|jgi:predicted alpha-1,2-mannosidase|uniref:GH92 family glycosyl hydrolase n=1 Tax=Mucilaginibacter sp. TaxID=1882438 RepID=UPI00356394B3